MNNLDKDMLCVMESAGERNALTPTQSFEQYRQAKYQELENFIATRRTVYLDMNFWIWLRTPDKSPNPIKIRRLLDLLRKGVKEKWLLCPVSYAVDSELMKQNPLEKRLAQAKIMDELSEGIGIRNPYNIAELEFQSFFRKHSISFKHVPTDPIWTRVGHIILEPEVECDLLPEDFMELTRKVMFDVMWAMTIEDAAKKMDGCPKRPATIAAKINAARQAYPRNGISFDKLFAGELHGILEAMTSELGENDQRFCMNLLREIVTQGQDNTAIPSQRINAALHAALRLDDNYKLKENDLDDIQHSAVAAAYCDVFLTERFMADKLRLPAVKKVISSKCKVVNDFDEAISILI